MSKKSIDEEGMGPLERGRGRYQRKDYKGALEAFTQAVNVSTEHLLLTALDHRAATYEKLEQLQPALRDAKRMIDLKPNLSKGYLRCGKVLQLKGENGLALKIYERGLNKVKIGADDQRTLLQSMFNKLRQAQDPGKSRDPLQYLPLELVEMVCQHLSMRDKVVCLGVSPSWKRLLESSHKLWTTFDTTSARKPISKSSLRLHLRRSNYTLDRAIITTRARFDLEKMKYLTRTCKKLKQLEMRGSGIIGESLTSALPEARSLEKIIVWEQCEITLAAAQLVLSTCQKSLAEASFMRVLGTRGGFIADRWPKLDSLRSIYLKGHRDSCLDLNGLRDATPNIKTVRLNCWKVLPVMVDLSSWKALEYLDLGDTQLGPFPTLPSTIKHLFLNNNPHLHAEPNEIEPAFLPNLETLDCSATFIGPETLKAMTAETIKGGHLKQLAIGNRLSGVVAVPVEEEFPASESIEDLSLAYLIAPEKRTIQTVSLYPNVKRLDVSASKVTGVAVKHFVNMGVKYLNLTECSEVNGDAVEWARGMGVEVEFNFPSRSSRPGAFREVYGGMF